MTKRHAVPFVLILVLLTACTTLYQQADSPPPNAPAARQATTPVPTTFEAMFDTAMVEPHAGLALPDTHGELFATSGRCTTCHINMVDEQGNNVSLGETWRSTMMANSSRDPYWQAAVRKEVLSNAQYKGAIEDKCSTCHTSMARATMAANGGTGALLDGGFLDPQHQLHTLAYDGVSCTMCHQITDDNLGQPESFSGHFVIDTEVRSQTDKILGPPETPRQVFGPSQLSGAMVEHMTAGSTYRPVQSNHIQESALCGSCHTLHTDFVNTDGELMVGSQFPEQMPYVEWLHSDYRDTETCQDCHMPVVEGKVLYAATAEEPRPDFNNHTFVGGNVYVLEMFRRFGDELETTASSYHFARQIQETLDLLHNETATIALEQTALSDTTLNLNVVVTNLTGHKFPSAYPSRRDWVHMHVYDADGELVFESGAVEQNGLIVGNDNDSDPTLYEPHYEMIDSADQVQIYETIMADSDGAVTSGLLQASAYLKDNRLLPAGFDKFTAMKDIAVHGKAFYDETFIGGSDTIEYRIDVSDAAAPLTVVADLYYQSISYRWAENYRPYADAPEIARFLRYYDAIPNLPVVIDSNRLVIGGDELGPGLPVSP